MKNVSKSTLGKIVLLVTTIIWGSSFCVVKNAVNVIPTNYILAIRFTIGAFVLSVFFYKKLHKININLVIRGAILGILLYLAFAIQTYGLETTTPGKNAFLTTIYCVVVPFLYAIIKKKMPDKFSIIASLLCIIGIGLVSLSGNFFISIGDLLSLICGLFFAMHIVAVAKFSTDYDPILLTIFQFLFAAILSWIFAGFTEQLPTLWNLSIIFSLLYIGIFSTSIALLLQNIGQKYTHPSTAALILSLESVFGVIFSAIFGFENLSAKKILGFAIIFIAIIISETKLNFIPSKKSKIP